MRRSAIAGFVILAMTWWTCQEVGIRVRPTGRTLLEVYKRGGGWSFRIDSPSWWPGHPPPSKRYLVLATIDISIRTSLGTYHEGPAESDVGFLDALERLEKTHKNSPIDRGLYDNVMGNFAADIIVIDTKTGVYFTCWARGGSPNEAFDEAMRLAKEDLRK